MLRLGRVRDAAAHPQRCRLPDLREGRFQKEKERGRKKFAKVAKDPEPTEAPPAPTAAPCEDTRADGKCVEKVVDKGKCTRGAGKKCLKSCGLCDLQSGLTNDEPGPDRSASYQYALGLAALWLLM